MPRYEVQGPPRLPRLLARGARRKARDRVRLASGLRGRRLRGDRRTGARAARALHGEVRRGDRFAALRLCGQGRTQGGVAAGDDTEHRAHGGGPRRRTPEAHQVVLSAGVLPLREATARSDAGLSPVERRRVRERRRGRRCGGDGRCRRSTAQPGPRLGRRHGAHQRPPPAAQAAPQDRRRRRGRARGAGPDRQAREG